MKTFAGVLVLCFLAATVSAESKVRIEAGDQTFALPHVEAVKVVRDDGTSTIVMLFAEKTPQNVTLVDDFGEDDLLSLGQWTSDTGLLAARLSFGIGDEENYSLIVHAGSENVSTGGHRSGDGQKGAFKTLQIKGERISGSVYHPAPPSTLSGTFDIPLKVVRAPKWQSGAVVAKSPQAAVLVAYAAAMRKFDFAAASRYSVNDEVAETKRSIAVMGEKRMKSMIRETFLTEKEFANLLASPDASMAETPTHTKIRLVKRSGSESEISTISLLNKDGEWKVRY